MGYIQVHIRCPLIIRVFLCSPTTIARVLFSGSLTTRRNGGSVRRVSAEDPQTEAGHLLELAAQICRRSSAALLAAPRNTWSCISQHGPRLSHVQRTWFERQARLAQRRRCGKDGDDEY